MLSILCIYNVPRLTKECYIAYLLLACGRLAFNQPSRQLPPIQKVSEEKHKGLVNGTLRADFQLPHKDVQRCLYVNHAEIQTSCEKIKLVLRVIWRFCRGHICWTQMSLRQPCWNTDRVCQCPEGKPLVLRTIWISLQESYMLDSESSQRRDAEHAKAPLQSQESMRTSDHRRDRNR